MPGTAVVSRSGAFLDRAHRGPYLEIITVTWVGDATDGSVPSVSLGKVYGLLQRLVTDPGPTAPTTLYDITMPDEDGFDALGGAGANRSATATEEAEIKMTTFQRIVANVLTFAIANQAVVSAQGIARLYVLR